MVYVQSLIAMVTYMNYGCSKIRSWGLSRVSIRQNTELGYRHSEKTVPAHWPPFITATGRRADSTDSTHYYGPARKSSHRGHRDARKPARFFRFPCDPLIHLAARKEKKKEENAAVYALRQVAGEGRCIKFYPVPEEMCVFFLLVKTKNGLNVCWTEHFQQRN